MSRILKSICILFLSVCVSYQGLAVYVLAPSQSDVTAQTDSASERILVVSLSSPLMDTDLHSHHDEQADKENVPAMWEIDTHGPSSHPPYLPLGSIRVAASENSNYPTPVYTLHRPPDVLS